MLNLLVDALKAAESQLTRAVEASNQAVEKNDTAGFRISTKVSDIWSATIVQLEEPVRDALREAENEIERNQEAEPARLQELRTRAAQLAKLLNND